LTSSHYKLLTDALVLFHFSFVAFVALGGLLALRWPRLGWLHIPAVLWVIWVETTGRICPLTPLENRLRESAGMDTYAGGFVDHYIMPILYPRGLTVDMQMTIAMTLVVMNLVSYGLIAFLIVRRRRRQRLATAAADPQTSQQASADEPATDNVVPPAAIPPVQ